MESQTFLCFGKNCHQRCRPQQFSALESHQQATQIKHKGIVVDRYLEKYTKFQNKIDEATASLRLLKSHIEEDSSKMIKHIEKVRDQSIERIELSINSYFTSQKSTVNYKGLMLQVENKDYSSKLTCHRMKEIIKIIEQVIKNDGFIESEIMKNQGKQHQFREYFGTELKKMAKIQLFSQNSTSLDLFSITQSSVPEKYEQNLSKYSVASLLSDLKFDISKKREETKKNVSQKVQIDQKSISINEQDHRDSKNIYTQAQKDAFSKSKKTYRRKQPRPVNQGSKPVTEINVISQENGSSMFTSSSFLKSESSVSSQSQYSSSYLPIYDKKQGERQAGRQDLSSGVTNRARLQQSSISDDDEDVDKLNQTLIEIRTEIMARQDQSEEDDDFLTIQQIGKRQNQITFFSTKVKIVKLLYYSVLRRCIPKLKFIAGDHTGYGIFFTNFCPGMKVGTCLSLFNCTFHRYQSSLEIRNDKNFKILTHDPPNIKVNMKGVSINKVITYDLYYPLTDKRCWLIRQVAQQLNRDRRCLYIYRMYVKVMAIMNVTADRVFCQVGDSSGRMLAYLKQSHRVPRISEGDVVRLLTVKGLIGRGKSKEDTCGQDVVYLDTEDETAKVLPHRFDFLEISNDVMSLQ